MAVNGDNMESQSLGELLGSLKELHETGAYSDLKIRCGDDSHNVHTAIVLPRSKLLAKMYGNLTAHELSTITLQDDDPQAMKLMLHYLYTLDYPQVQPDQHDAAITNGVNGLHLDDTKHSNGNYGASLKEYSIENEQFVEAHPPSENGSEPGPTMTSKKAKKKKRKSTVAATDMDPVLDKSIPKPPSNLIVHAKLYALSSKYGIEGLKSLSAEKFEREVEKHWDGEDFLGAAQEAYTSTEVEDRKLRDKVLETFKKHPEMLGWKNVQEKIRTLELSFDLLMYMRAEGSS